MATRDGASVRSILREWLVRLRGLRHASRSDADLREELQGHLEMAEADARRRGHSADARRVAILRSGGAAQAIESLRDQHGLPWLRDLGHDIRHAARAFSRSPGFTVAALVILALGVGAASTAFAVVHGVVIRALPYPAPDRLVRVWDTNAPRGLTDFPASVANFRSWQQESRSFEALGAWRYGYATLTSSDHPQRVALVLVTGNLLSVLGLRPLAGRGFLTEEDQPGRNTAVLISQRLWRQQYGRESDVVGQTMTLDGKAHTIVGVAPPAFEAIVAADVWKPMADDGDDEARSLHWLRVVGRLRPGVSLGQAQSDMDVVTGRLAQRFPRSNENWGVRLESFRDWILPAGTVRSLIVLLCAVLCVLLIASANLANLFLVRAMARAREMAVRAALGAGRGRLARQLLAEAVLIVCGGSAISLLLTAWSLELLRTSSAGDLPRMQEVGLDVWTVLFAVGAGACSALAVSMPPLWRLGRVTLHGSLTDRSTTGPTGRVRLVQNALIVTQLSLSVVLLVTSAQLVDAFLRLTRAPLGFQPAGVQTFSVSPPASQYADTSRRAAFYQTLSERIAARHGVRGVSTTSAIPFGPAVDRLTTRVTAPDSPAALQEEPLSVERFSVRPDFFRAIDTPLVAGRLFTSADTATAAPVAIVSETAARRLWPDADPIGKTLVWNSRFTVVGVASDIRNVQLDHQPQPAIYFPTSQQPLPTMTYVVRTDEQMSNIMDDIRRDVRALDPALPVFGARRLDDVVAQASTQPRFNAGLTGTFAFASLLLTGVGLYGVTAYTVSRRRREFALRIALGAHPSAVLGLVMRLGATLTVLGLVLGGTMAFAAMRVLSASLDGVRPVAPFMLATAATVLCCIGLVACWLPARCVTGIDPAVTLRED